MTSQESEVVKASVDFLRVCVESTPLRRFVDLLDVDSGPLASCLVEGFESFRPDAARNRVETADIEKMFEQLHFAPCAQAIYFYRVSRAMFLRGLPRVPDVLAAVSRQLTGVEIYYSANIGPGLRVIHGIGTVIGAMSAIGSNFTLYQGVTIGDKLGADTGTDKRPVIGDKVIASAGCTILGPVRIGSETIIGANAMVIHSVPERCIAVGVPAKVKAEGLTDEQFDLYWKALKD